MYKPKVYNSLLSMPVDRGFTASEMAYKLNNQFLGVQTMVSELGCLPSFYNHNSKIADIENTVSMALSVMGVNGARPRE